MPGWDGFDVPAWAQRELGIPALVDNDVNIMAVGERTVALPVVDDVLFIKVATGIGAGIISGGMLQRVLIALALAESPDLLIADEPTTALDATVQAEVLDLLAALRRDTGLSLLFVSHDLAVVAGICDRIVVMRHGVIVEEGATAEVLAAPRHPYTRALLAAHREYGLDRLRTPLDDREVAHV